MSPRAETPHAIVVAGGSPHKCLGILVEAAGSANGINISLPASGTLGHSSVELLRHASGTGNMPFRSRAPALVSLLGGQTDSAVDVVGLYKGHIKVHSVALQLSWGSRK